MFKEKKKLNIEEKEELEREKEKSLVISIRIISLILVALIFLINKDLIMLFKEEGLNYNAKDFSLSLNYLLCVIVLFLSFLGSFSNAFKVGGEKNG